VAVFLAQKFGWHIPTYRGQDIFAGCGWAPSRSSINDLFNQADVILAPLFKQMQSLIFKESIVLGDDTTLRLLTRDSLDQDQEQELELRRQRNNPVATRRIKISREVLLAMHGFTTGWTMGLLTTYFTGRLAVVKRLFRRI
jgi:hypothetical protein